MPASRYVSGAAVLIGFKGLAGGLPRIRLHNGRLSQHSLNLISNFGTYVLSGAVSLWFIPYLIAKLGPEGYGLIPFTSQVTAYLSVLVLALNGGVGRFLAIELTRSDHEAANRVFNTAFISSTILALGLTPVLMLIASTAPSWVNTQPQHSDGTVWLFAAAFGSFLVSTLRSSFAVSTWAQNRFDLRCLATTGTQIARVIWIVILFQWNSPSLELVATGFAVEAVLGLAVDTFLWRKLTPMLKISFHWFDWTRLRLLFDMGGWMVINQVGSLLLLSIDLIVVNQRLGPTAAGHYGALLFWPMTLRVVAGSLSGILAPTVTVKYAQGDYAAITDITRRGVKLLGLAVALPVGMICGLAGPLLNLWLGPDFTADAALLVVMTGHLAVNLAVMPLFNVQTAFNKVKWPGIVTLITGVANLAIALAFLQYSNLGMIGVALAGCIALTAKNLLYTPAYSSRILRVPWSSFLGLVLPSVGVGAILGGVGFIGSQLWEISTLPRLVAGVILLSAAFATFVWRLALDGDDKAVLRGLVGMPAR